LLGANALDEPSVFRPENLLREGRLQRGRPDQAVRDICLLDPDGDVVWYLREPRSGGVARPLDARLGKSRITVSDNEPTYGAAGTG
jgi:hypothetical protein